MDKLEFTEFELKLIKVAVRTILENNMTVVFKDDYVKLLEKIQNACMQENK